MNLTTSAPGSGAGSSGAGTSSTSGGSGTCTATLLDEVVLPNGQHATVIKCTCGDHKYYCKVIISSLEEAQTKAKVARLTATPAYLYQSVGANPCTLIENHDGSFTEIQENGDAHDYLPASDPDHPGQIFRVRKTIPQPGT